MELDGINLAEGTILIVDDEPGIIEVLSDCLSPLGAKIKTANNGKEAVDLVKSQPIDAIVSDVKMPVMTGLQLLAEIRALGYLTPFVIVTGFSDKPTLIEAIRLDATDFLDKPFNTDEVYKIMTRALNLGMLQRKADSQIDRVYNSSNLPADEIVKAKKYQKVMARMRIETEVFRKKTS